MAYEQMALCVSPPVRPFARPATAAAGGEEFELDSSFHGKWVSIQAQGEDFYIRVFVAVDKKGVDSGTTVAATTDSTIASQVLTYAAGTTIHIPNGSRFDFDLSQLPTFNPQKDAIKIRHVSPAATSGAKLRLWKSSGQVGA